MSHPTISLESSDLPELHDEIHEAARLSAGAAAARLQQVLNTDLVLDGLVQHTLAGSQTAGNQPLDLQT